MHTTRIRTPPTDVHTDHVTEDDLESSVLLLRHMQSGQGNEYIESFGLLISIPFESLCARILSICRLKLFHLEEEHMENIHWSKALQNKHTRLHRVPN